MNILVTGANGQLGTALRHAAAGSGDNWLFTDVDTLDITDEKGVGDFVAEHGIGLIVNCAAFTNVDGAETAAEAARRLNADAPGILARVARLHDAAIIHISTDYVFGGVPHNIPLTEDDLPSPLGVYGKTKLDGEWQVAEANPRHIIIRTAWLYGETGKNFVRTMLRLTSSNPRVKVVFDQAGTPTYAPDLARAIVSIAEQRGWQLHPGIYHFSNEGVCSWYDLAWQIARAANPGCSVIPCHSSEYPSPVTRPAYSVLDKTKIKRTFSLSIPHWTLSLNTCLENLLK